MPLLYNNIVFLEIINKDIEFYIEEHLSLLPKDYYLLFNGKRYNNELKCSTDMNIHVVPRLLGGKGGFGSMLRAIGAQIEKTTNREACRDLSGRRLRDINEEQRLKNWIATQADREKESAAKKQKKLERLCEKPRHEFRDEAYDKERALLPEQVEDAVEQGMKASCSTKRTATSDKVTKKKKLWIDDELSDSDLDDSDEDITTKRKCEEDDGSNKKIKLNCPNEKEICDDLKSTDENIEYQSLEVQCKK